MRTILLPKNLLLLCTITFALTLSAQSYEIAIITDLGDLNNASRSANFVDMNGDGWDDIFFSNGLSLGQNNALYINNGDGSFSLNTSDITTDDSRSDGATFADVDNDGDLDAFVVTYGYASNGNLNYFYRNNGDGDFTYEQDADMSDELTFSEMANWIDINNDQFLDLYVTNSNGSQTNLYYENQGNGSFLQRTDLSITDGYHRSRSVDWVDYDADGDFDLFITNEDNTENQLFRNDGPDNFTAITDLSFLSDERNSAGSSWADVDNDGDFDLFIANYDNQSNQLFLNEDGVFTEQLDSEINEGPGFSFGSAFGDMDNDGDLDLFVCNAYLPSQDRNYVYINDGNGNFSRDTLSVIALHTGYTFGCAFGDYDQDGWLDLILANTQSESQSNSLFHNTGSGNNWVQVLCQGTTSNFSAVGTTVKALSMINGEEVWQTRQIRAAEGYCSQNSYTQHFGLAEAEVLLEVEVQWPSGLVETFYDLDVNQHYVIGEGNGIVNGLSEVVQEHGIRVHPNPSNGDFTISFDRPWSGSMTISLIDLKGDLVFAKNYQSSERIWVTTNELPAGEYILQIGSDSKNTSTPLIIK